MGGNVLAMLDHFTFQGTPFFLLTIHSLYIRKYIRSIYYIKINLFLLFLGGGDFFRSRT